MATFSCNYLDIGKGLLFDGGNRWVLYGADFNPSNQSVTADHVTVYQPTTNFDLTGFQPGHEVGACAFEVQRDGPGAQLTQWVEVVLEGYNSNDGWLMLWVSYFQIYWNSISSGYYERNYIWVYFGVDYDEIRPRWSKYRMHIFAEDGTWEYYSPEFTVSNLSIDSSFHTAGYVRVNGNNLCYIDGAGADHLKTGKGFKHRIAYDSNYSTYVGTDKAGRIWLDSGDNLRIYYVDENGYKRRTYSSDAWYGGNINVGISKRGYIWVSGGDTADSGYGYLCFIAPNGSKRRILNGPPAGYS